MTDRPDTDLQSVLQAAMFLVAANGLKGLSLRPLAEQLGSTVSALTHRFGRKDELLGALIDAASAQDAAFFAKWLGRIEALGVRDGALMADLVDAILADLVGPEALRERFLCELLQGAVSRPEIAPALAAWSDRRREFWRVATAELGETELGDVLHAFSTDEAAYGLALGDVAAYRWLRRLSLRRLCCGLIPAEGATDLRQFWVFHAALGDLFDEPGCSMPEMTEWQARTAGHISSLIIAEGADAVTHRAIAARAGMAYSTLAYHFPRQEDLLLAGLNDIVAKISHAITPEPGQSNLEYRLTSIELARATFALALVATRMPSLKAIAADMRRTRGEHFVVYLERQLGEAAFDVLAAQAMSVTGMGRLILDAVLDPTANDSAFRLTERMQADALAARKRN